MKKQHETKLSDLLCRFFNSAFGALCTRSVRRRSVVSATRATKRVARSVCALRSTIRRTQCTNGGAVKGKPASGATRPLTTRQSLCLLSLFSDFASLHLARLTRAFLLVSAYLRAPTTQHNARAKYFIGLRVLCRAQTPCFGGARVSAGPMALVRSALPPLPPSGGIT